MRLFTIFYEIVDFKVIRKHTRETVNLYTTGAPWKEKLTVSGVEVVGSN